MCPIRSQCLKVEWWCRRSTAHAWFPGLSLFLWAASAALLLSRDPNFKTTVLDQGCRLASELSGLLKIKLDLVSTLSSWLSSLAVGPNLTRAPKHLEMGENLIIGPSW